MMDNIKRTFELKEEAKEGYQPEKPSEQMTLDSGIKTDNTPSKERINGPEFQEAKTRTVSESLKKTEKAHAMKGISNKVREIRRVLIHVLCGSGLFEIPGSIVPGLTR